MSRSADDDDVDDDVDDEDNAYMNINDFVFNISRWRLSVNTNIRDFIITSVNETRFGSFEFFTNFDELQPKQWSHLKGPRHHGKPPYRDIIKQTENEQTRPLTDTE